MDILIYLNYGGTGYFSLTETLVSKMLLDVFGNIPAYN